MLHAALSMVRCLQGTIGPSIFKMLYTLVVSLSVSGNLLHILTLVCCSNVWVFLLKFHLYHSAVTGNFGLLFLYCSPGSLLHLFKRQKEEEGDWGVHGIRSSFFLFFFKAVEIQTHLGIYTAKSSG